MKTLINLAHDMMSADNVRKAKTMEEKKVALSHAKYIRAYNEVIKREKNLLEQVEAKTKTP